MKILRFYRKATFIQFLRDYLNRQLLDSEIVFENISRFFSKDQFVVAPLEVEKLIKVSWEILPLGEHPFLEIVKHCEKLQERNSKARFELGRLKRINELEPTEIYQGVDEFDGYFVFYFRDSGVAILDCPTVGVENVSRIIHSGDWFRRLCAKLPQQITAK